MVERLKRERERERVLRLFYPKVESSILAHNFAASVKISKKREREREREQEAGIEKDRLVGESKKLELRKTVEDNFAVTKIQNPQLRFLFGGVEKQRVHDHGYR
jgi:hypothetical protein